MLGPSLAQSACSRLEPLLPLYFRSVFPSAFCCFLLKRCVRLQNSSSVRYIGTLLAKMASVGASEKQQSTYISSNQLEGTGNTSLTGNIDYNDIHVSKLVRKIDWRILPGVILLYLLSFLDRSNVANAKVEGLAEDTKMSMHEMSNSRPLC